MTADIKKLSDSLRSDTPERRLERDIQRRRAEYEADLERGETVEIRDIPGKIIRISPRGREFSNNR